MFLEKIKIIVGASFKDIGRAGNTLWITAGNDIINNGTERRKYSIHVQCPWRITKNSKIILASGDIYIPSSNYQYTEEEGFQWDILGNNKFDEYIASEKIFLQDLVVKNVHVDELGGLKIIFNNQTVFESFINSSIDDEFWRFIEYNHNSSEHVVVFE